ncbi:MAG: hypothetical protein AMXMBFR84_17740 [Candidatus Hydrogenedentota bacterium]
MIAPRQTDRDSGVDRTRDLESQVSRLTAEVEHLRRTVRAIEGDHLVSSRPTWLSRCALVTLTIVLGLAAALTIDFSAENWSDVVQLNDSMAEKALPYPLLVVAILVLLALGAYVIHLRFTFPALASLAIYLAYAFYLRDQPLRWPYSEPAYFWFSFGLLTFSYSVFSLAMAWEVRHTIRGRRRLVFVAVPQSFFYFVLAWHAVHRRYPGDEWPFVAMVAAGLFVLAGLADTPIKARNTLSPLFRMKGVLAANFALVLAAPTMWVPVIMAAESVLVSLWYRMRPENHLKVISVGLAVTASYFVIGALRYAEPVLLGSLRVPPEWFIAVSVPALFAVVAAIYDQFGRTHERSKSMWDPANNVVSLLHAAASALMLILVVISENGDSPALPYMLCLVALPMGAVGWLLRTPQIEAGAVLVLMAGHVAFYYFLLNGTPLADMDPNTLLLGCAMAAFTLFAARRWERYLNRFQGGSLWEHEATAGLPFVAAAVQLSVLLVAVLPPDYSALGILILGGCLIGSSTLVQEPVLRAAGTLVLLIAAWQGSRLPEGAYPVANAVALIGGLVAAERLLRYTAGQDHGAKPRRATLLRTVTVGIVLGFALNASQAYVSDRNMGLAWLGIACGLGTLGILFKDRVYAFMAQGSVVLTLIWYAVNAPQAVDGMLVFQLVGLTALAVGLSAAAVLVSIRRFQFGRRLGVPAGRPVKDPPVHG